jgi:hypothetical protein
LVGHRGPAAVLVFPVVAAAKVPDLAAIRRRPAGKVASDHPAVDPAAFPVPEADLAAVPEDPAAEEWAEADDVDMRDVCSLIIWGVWQSGRETFFARVQHDTGGRHATA